MKKHGVNKFIGFLLLLSLINSMLFSFVSFAKAYTGAYLYTGVDPITGLPITEVRGVNPTGQTFSGENKIEMNAYNNAPILTDNTFNGSTDIDTAFTNITSNGNTYNGTTTLEYSSVTGGTLQSSGDSFRATSVEASDADVSISNGTFNGALTVNANSVSLGSVSQMDLLIDTIYLALYGLNNWVYRDTPLTLNLTSPSGNTVQWSAAQYWWNRGYWNDNTHTWSVISARRYCSTLGAIQFVQDSIYETIYSIGRYLAYTFGPKQVKMYTFTWDDQFYSFNYTTGNYSYIDMIDNRISIVLQFLNYISSRFYTWYYPLMNVQGYEHWRFYNTDTGQEEEIGLAGLMYNISWYLGQLYALQVESGPLSQLADDVDDAVESMASMEAQEEAVISSISSGITSFVPDLSELGAFTALAWCSNYLQQCWVSLGMYGTVIMIGLLLAVCMQFIGYFRYK